MGKRIESFRDIGELYDVALCDVWGVLHNGVAAYREASVALEAARASGLTVVLITNSPRVALKVVEQLRAIGVPDSVYDRIITSGDVTRRLIAEGPKKVFLLGPERDIGILEDLDVERVDAGEAESIVCTGFFDDETETPDDYTDMLTAWSARKVPMICANPDLVVERGHRMIPCAGAMAAYYERLGGETRIAGKPHQPIYDAALAAAREVRSEFPLSRVVAIGDGMPTDVRGALDYGLDLLYISHGIHAREYVVEGHTDEAALGAFLAREQASPKWWMPRLV
ncbi:TIGR01459 family HAD-type hydrolase [Rhizobium sp. P40RR-XXII]|uniref:TIGR01459 family HAD-type hydrolase n=1 Tax=unclassified Rhizobium TaxID=2613769 RepID=UPI00145631AC|nr:MULTISPECIES: TIGR01459 family HAD-type hydrolase [unclassified Rhizobium]NLR87024.1 TIGR01459 family HAD-type hydrolase [Rhizobium sp. P28RR-XV]NLS17955.1 TIGR01459 family HAD-type hydrolase [Rhizobium sp. P40RR-XXII]